MQMFQMCDVQVADFLFAQSALPHDPLHEPLLRILALGFAGSGAAAASLSVSTFQHIVALCLQQCSQRHINSVFFWSFFSALKNKNQAVYDFFWQK